MPKIERTKQKSTAVIYNRCRDFKIYDFVRHYIITSN